MEQDELDSVIFLVVIKILAGKQNKRKYIGGKLLDRENL